MLASDNQMKELEAMMAEATKAWAGKHGLILDRELRNQISDYLIADDPDRPTDLSSLVRSWRYW